MTASYNVKVYAIEARESKTPSYRVRWVVDGHRFGASFGTRALADSERSKLVTAQNAGEPFDTETGRPVPEMRALSDVTFWRHAQDFVAWAWPNAAAKSRVGFVETVLAVAPVLVKDLPGRPGEELLRSAIRAALLGTPLDDGQAKALAWLARASRPLSCLTDGSVVADVLDALALGLRGKPASAEFFSRRRRVLHKILGYAVRKKRLSVNPLDKSQLPDDWTPPEKPDDTVDPRSIAGPEVVSQMIAACASVGKRQGPRFVGFYATIYYGMLRPSEVAALTRDACTLPETGWGYLVFADSSPTAGKSYTDSGTAHEDRGLKGRTKGSARARTRKPSRRVPIPQPLVTLLRAHIETYGSSPDGRLFRSERGAPLQASTWTVLWKKVRAASLTPAQQRSPLMARPYDLRHAGIVWRLNSGVPPAEVAAWAGHSVEMLHRVYTHCVTGSEDVWLDRMDRALGDEG